MEIDQPRDARAAVCAALGIEATPHAEFEAKRIRQDLSDALGQIDDAWDAIASAATGSI